VRVSVEGFAEMQSLAESFNKMVEALKETQEQLVQKEKLAVLEKQGVLSGIKLFSVDYDKETGFKKELRVTAQSTLVAFHGPLETGRLTGATKEEVLKEFIVKSLTSLTLTRKLKLMKTASSGRMSPEKKKIMDEAAEELRTSQLAKKALKVGRLMPDFSLPDSTGRTVRLKDLLKDGPVILAFYRGSWCPYCNAQLASYQEHLGAFKAKGARLVGVTPEKPDLTALMRDGKKLGFTILSDADNKLAKKLGLVFGVPAELKKLYLQFGIDLEKSQGNPDWELPVPATYVVAKDGRIIYAFVDPDYTHRADPEDILKALK
ncbi:MAG: redoxin domain-containing protein, partial [Elusimicrobiales bacterium]|nr:redoxin domain-containing protein [Elusimicrobiales bacterium]